MASRREGFARCTFALTPFLLAGLLAGPAPAQVPPGWLVFSSFRDPLQTRPGPGGLWRAHPQDATVPIEQIGNMPAELTGATYPNDLAGANCVAWRASDEALVVGETGPENATIALQVLHVGGSPLQVTVAQRIVLGTMASPYGGGVSAVATLPNQDVMFVTFGLGNNLLVGILDAHTNHVRQLQVQFPPGFDPGLNALAVDSTGTYAYIGTDTSVTAYGMDIYRVPIAPGPVTPTLIASIPLLGFALALDPSDSVLTVVGRYGTSQLIQIDLATNTQTTLPGLPRYNALALEENSGEMVTAAGVGTGSDYLAYRMPSASSPAIALAPPPAGGWGITSGVVATTSMREYGRATARTNSYRWSIRPNAGGTPYVGNLGFGLTVEGSPAATPGILWLADGVRQHPINLFGLKLWLEPWSTHFGGLVVPHGTTATIALPIPASPALRGLEVAAQTVHVSGRRSAALDATPALRYWLH